MLDKKSLPLIDIDSSIVTSIDKDQNNIVTKICDKNTNIHFIQTNPDNTPTIDNRIYYDWTTVTSTIRHRFITYFDFGGDKALESEFQKFKRPWFYGLVGKKRWMRIYQCHDYNKGLELIKK